MCSTIVTISTTFTADMHATLISSVKISQRRQVNVKYKYVDQTSTEDFIFDSNSNVFRIFQHFKDIRCRNVHDLDLVL